MFGNPLEDQEMDRQTLQGWKDCIDNAHHFGAHTVAGFTGRLRGRPLTDSLPRYKEIWSELAKRAAELDKQYGRNPDLAKLPMYCTVMSLKDWYDAKDMRATGGNDVNFAMDAPRVDSPDIAVLREKGAIIYAISSASNVPGAAANGPHQPTMYFPEGSLQYEIGRAHV